jgi:dTMP kinase
MKLVCITGIDGTGKTTLARNTAAALNSAGNRAVYVYGRTTPIISRLLMALGRATLLRKNDLWGDYPSYNASKKKAMRSPILAGLYTAAILLDYYVQVWLKLLPYLWSDHIVVADRYLYDTVISDLAVHLNYTAAQTTRALRMGLSLLPRPLLTVLIDVPPEIAFARKDDVPHIEYLQERREWYLTLPARPEVEVFDGQAAPGDLVQALQQAIAGRERRIVGENNL